MMTAKMAMEALKRSKELSLRNCAGAKRRLTRWFSMSLDISTSCMVTEVGDHFLAFTGIKDPNCPGID
jgi:hypothetical protein